MNSKTIINIWQNFLKQNASLPNVTNKLRNSGHNWLQEMESGVRGKFQKGLTMGKDWSDSQISSIQRWAMDVHLGPDQMSKISETERKKKVKILNELREKLDRICVGANYGKVIGNGGEILGSSGAVIGYIMSLYGLPSGSDVTSIGNLVRFGGTFIDIASKIFESHFSEKSLKEVEARLKEDKEFSRILEKWSEYATQAEVDARVRAITGMSPASKNWNIVVKVCREFCKLISSGMDRNEALNLIKQGKYSKHIGNDVKIETLEKLYDNISASPLLANRISSSLSVFNLKPEYTKILIQILILIVCCSFENMFISLYCKVNPGVYSESDSKSFSEVDPVDDPEGYSIPESDFKAFLEACSVGDPVVDSKCDSGVYSESDSKPFPEVCSEGDFEADSKNVSDGESKRNPRGYSGGDTEDDPKITTARKVSYSNVFQGINIAHSYNSLMKARRIIRRGVSQHSDTLKGIVEALNKKSKF